MKLIKSILNFFKSTNRSIIKAHYNNKVLEIEYDNGDIEQYKGNSTVWYKMPYMKRCNVRKELKLNEIQEYIKQYGNPYPTAHQK